MRARSRIAALAACGLDPPGVDRAVKRVEGGSQRVEGAQRRLQIETFAGRLLIALDRRPEFRRRRPPVDRQSFGVGEVQHRRRVQLDVLPQHVAIGDLEGVVLGMPDDVAAAAADHVVAVLLERFGRHHRGRAEAGRDADVVEGVVAVALRPLAAGLLAGRRAHDRLDRSLALAGQADAPVAGRPAAAGRVAVHVHDAAVGEVLREGVGEPGAAAIAAGGVAGPPGEADRAAQLVALRPQHARDLEHAGIAGAVVADAFAPAVVVAVHQHELLGLDRAL